MMRSHNYPDQEDIDDNDDETEMLVVSSSGPTSVPRRRLHRTPASASSMTFIMSRSTTTIKVLATSMVVLALMSLLAMLSQATSANHKLQHDIQHEASKQNRITFTCPDTLPLKNFDEELFEEDYLKDANPNVLDDTKHFIETFRDETFDGRPKTFTEFQDYSRDLVKGYILPHVSSGMSIFESAMGIGLNVYSLLEILHEEGGISDLTVYGNEYLKESAEKANQVLDVLLPLQDTGTDPKNQKGVICAADSTDLSFIPDDSFDFVYTGYISPLWDPLELGNDFSTNNKIMLQLCPKKKKRKKKKKNPQNDDKEDWRDAHLVTVMQHYQEDWFDQWITEMIRIAQPGAAIVVEEVAAPICVARDDWGGIEPAFFTQRGISKYGWNVHPDSIQVIHHKDEDEEDDRYYVVMKKNQ